MTRTPALLVVLALAAASATAAQAWPGAPPGSVANRPVAPVARGPSAPASVPVPPGVGATASHRVSAADRSRWRWPLVPRPAVLRPFRAPASDYGAGHRGLDLASTDGAVVLAVEGGVVTHAGVVAGRGTVTVTHPGGLRSTYEPLAPGVGVGAAVAAGDPLGTVWSRAAPSHCGARVCLHLGARRGSAYLDPYPLLTAGRLALLPLR